MALWTLATAATATATTTAEVPVGELELYVVLKERGGDEGPGRPVRLSDAFADGGERRRRRARPVVCFRSGRSVRVALEKPDDDQYVVAIYDGPRPRMAFRNRFPVALTVSTRCRGPPDGRCDWSSELRPGDVTYSSHEVDTASAVTYFVSMAGRSRTGKNDDTWWRILGVMPPTPVDGVIFLF